MNLTTARIPDNLKVKGEGHRTDFRIFHHCEIWQKKLVDTITHEPLHSTWWNFAWTNVFCFSVCIMLRLPADST